MYKYPKYRSQQDRYWDRGMVIHIAMLLRVTLEEGPLAWSELRRKLPAYAQGQAQEVLDQQLGQGLLHRHPRTSSRSGERFGVRPPDPRDYLRQALPELFATLTKLGFTRPNIRAAALELLHEEEWDTEPPPEAPPAAEARAARAASPADAGHRRDCYDSAAPRIGRAARCQSSVASAFTICSSGTCSSLRRPR